MQRHLPCAAHSSATLPLPNGSAPLEPHVGESTADGPRPGLAVASREPAEKVGRRLAAILGAGFLLHLILLPFGRFKYDTDLMTAWARRLTTQPLGSFYASRRLEDHLPGDLWILWGIAHLHILLWSERGLDGSSFLIFLKLVPVVADVGIGLVLFLVGRRLGGPAAGLRAAAFIAFSPGPIFLAATWGQWDAVSALVALVAVYIQLRRRIEWSLPVLVYAVLIKPPFAAVAPIFLLAHLGTEVLPRWRSCRGEGVQSKLRTMQWPVLRGAMGWILALVVVFAVNRPFDVGLPLLPARWSLTQRISYALNAHPQTTLNAFNLWALFVPGKLAAGHFTPDGAAALLGLSAKQWGEILFAAAYFAILTLYWRRRDDAALVWAALAVTTASFVLPTRVHERYLFPAVVFGALVAALAPRLRWVYLALAATYTADLFWVYDRFYGLGLPGWWQTNGFVVAVSTVNVLLLVLMLTRVLPVLQASCVAGISERARIRLPQTRSLGLTDGSPSGTTASVPEGLPSLRPGIRSGAAGWGDSTQPAPWIPAGAWALAARADWVRIGLGGILGLAAFLDFYRLNREGFGNLYYAAGVKSMLTSWHAFFFVSFDSGGFVSVDKPPLGLWLQAASAAAFGLHGWSLLLPQALAGVLAVAVLYHLVARTFGPVAGLLAGLALAVTPIDVVTDRNNTMDGTLVLALLLAAWAALIAAETGRWRPLLLCAMALGLGFNIKMLEAFLILPVCFGLYLLGAPRRFWVRIGQLLVAGFVLFLVSFSWAVAVDLTPANDRPYVGSSIGNSELELIVGHNGLDRLLPGGPMFRRADQEISWFSGGVVSRASAGPAGPFRLLDGKLAPQVGWLLPLAMFGFIAAFGTAGHSRREDRKSGRRADSGNDVDGLADQTTTGAATNQSRRDFVGSAPDFNPVDPPTENNTSGWLRNRKRQALFLWSGWFVTVAAFFSVANYFHYYYLVVLAPAIAALVGIGVPALWAEFSRWDWRDWRGWLLPAAVLTTAGLQWRLLTRFHTWDDRLTPVVLGLVLVAVAVLIDRRWVGRAAVRGGPVVVAIGALALFLAPLVWAALPVWEGSADPNFPYAGPQRTIRRVLEPSAANRSLVAYLDAHRDGAEFIVATIDASDAAPLELATNDPVMALGGFSGGDPILTLDPIKTDVAHGKVRYFYLSALERHAMGGQSGGTSRLARWVTGSCAAVPASVWEGPNRNSMSRALTVVGGGLYDCGEPADTPSSTSGDASPARTTPLLIDSVPETAPAWQTEGWAWIIEALERAG